jgi:Fe2+ or Zn2+ uptake regulation protein
MPPDPNLGLLPGHTARLGKRRRRTANCRDEVIAALHVLVAQHGDRPFLAHEVYTQMVAQGTSYAEPTVYNAMQRMKVPDPRLPDVLLERAGKSGFRLVCALSLPEPRTSSICIRLAR